MHNWSKFTRFFCAGFTIAAASLFFITSLHAQSAVTQKHHGDEYPEYPKPNYGTGEHAKLIKRGEYLTKAGDCISCHSNTKEGGKAFAGGLGIKTPFGTFYSPNITPDKETGIGDWSDKDFVRAVHAGRRNDGANLYPVFSYVSFTKIRKKDLLAIKAYLFSIPAVHQENRKNDVSWPFSWRFLQWGWKLLFFDKGYYKNDPSKSAVWNRGAYLVQGLGHCGECHTPRNIFGGMKKNKYLTGAFVDGYYAPDITSYGLGDAPMQEVIDVFVKEQKLGAAGKVGGPMAEVDHNSLEYLKRKDLEAIVIYLKTVKGIPHEKAAPLTGKLSTKQVKKLYDGHCAVCHDTGAAGAPKIGDVAAWAPRIKLGMKALYQNSIKGINSMPAMGACITCSGEQMHELVDYMVEHSRADGKKAKMRTIPEAPKKLTLEDGKKLYEKHCAVCHSKPGTGAPQLGDKNVWEPLIAKNIDVLYKNTIEGYKTMPAAKVYCSDCSDAELIVAVKYLVEQSKTKGDYRLW